MKNRPFVFGWLAFALAGLFLSHCSTPETNTAAATPTATASPVAESEVAVSQTITATVTIEPTATLPVIPTATAAPTTVITPTAAPTIAPPVTALPPVPVFAGLMKHELVVVNAAGQPSTLSYLTGVESEEQIAALQAVVQSEFDGGVRLPVDPDRFRFSFSPNREWLALFVEPPIDLETDGGGIGGNTAILNESGDLLDTLFPPVLSRWLPDNQGYFRSSYGFVSLVYLDGQPGVDFSQISSMGSATMSPDGQTIFYLKGGGGGPAALWRMNADGSEPTLVFDPGTGLTPPFWSPNGQWVAVGQQNSVWFANSEGSELFSVEAPGHFPIWSVDSQMIALHISLQIRNNRDLITLIEVGRQQVYELHLFFPEGALGSTGSNTLAGLTWSPDSTQLAFLIRNRQPDNRYTTDVWLVNVDGSGLQRITQDGTEKDELRWIP